MSTRDELSRLFEAERHELPGVEDVRRGWARLEGALVTGAAPMALSYAPLKLGFSAVLKWLVSGFAVGMVAGGAALAWSPSEPKPRAPGAVVIAPTVERTTQAPATSASAPPAAPSLAAPPASNPEGRDAAFGEELRLIQLAKREIDGGRAHLAQVWLDEHARRFPQGVFRTEREALLVFVACAGDDRARGQRQAEEFLRANPRSPLVDRISRACALAEPVPQNDPKFDK